MRQILFCCLAWFTLLGGCTLPLPLPPLTPPTRPLPTAPAPQIDDTVVTLAYGETAPAADGDLLITFAALLEDSRCPADVQCAWSGWVRIQLLVEQTGAPPVTVEITVFTDYDGMVNPVSGPNLPQPFADVNDYRLTLRQVTPYPAEHGNRPPVADYQIVLTVV